jgi:hypothetical protein
LLLGYLSDDLPETLSDFHCLAHVARFADDAVLPVEVGKERGELLLGQGVGLGLLRHGSQSTGKNRRKYG